MTALVVVRHGRTEANAGRRLLGRLDLPLDPLGQAQADALGQAIARGGPVHRVVSSPLRRTRQTAGAIAARVGREVEVEVDERLVELDYGEYDGRPLDEVPADVWRRWREDPHFALPGGESLVALRRRVEAALEELAAAPSEGSVVLVSHVSPIKAAVTWALGVGDEATWRLFVAPASITRIELGPRGPVVHSFNEVAHLDRLTT